MVSIVDERLIVDTIHNSPLKNHKTINIISGPEEAMEVQGEGEEEVDVHH